MISILKPYCPLSDVVPLGVKNEEKGLILLKDKILNRK